MATVSWICKGYWDNARPRLERHAGVADAIPARCPHCGTGCEKRTTCGCGHPIDDCRQSICHHPFADAD